MNSRQERQDYFTANRPLFDSLSSAFEAALSLSASRVLLHRTAETDFSFVEGQYTPEELAELLPADPNPEELAKEQNADLCTHAETSLGSLRRLLNYLRPDDQPPLFEPEGEPTLVAFSSGVWRRIELSDDDDPTLEGNVAAVEIFGDPGETIETAAGYELSITIKGVRDFLVLIMANGRPEAVNYSVRAAEDPLHDRCQDMFGSRSKAMDLLWGMFESEDELDSSLATIASATKGIYPDHEVQTLLASIRDRALRDRQIVEWNRALGMTMPTHEKLRSIIAFLRSLR